MKTKKVRANAIELRARAEKVFAQISPDKSNVPSPLTAETAEQTLYELSVHQIELEIQNDELRRSQFELDTSRARYLDLYEFAPTGYCTLTEKGLLTEANLTLATLLGIARSTLLEQPFSNFIATEDQDIFYLLQKQLLVSNVSQVDESQSCELRVVKGNGTPIWIHLTATVSLSESGDANLRLAATEINARKQAEQALRASGTSLREVNENLEILITERTSKLRHSESLFRTLAEISPVGIFRAEASGKIVYLNARCCEIIGLPLESAKGHGWTSSVHPEDRKSVLKEWKQSVAANRSFVSEHRFQHADGRLVWGQVQSQPESDSTGEIVGHVGVLVNITERKLAEAALLESNRVLDTLFNNLPGMAYRCLRDKDRTMNILSGGCLAVTGYERSELLNNRVVSYGVLIHPEDTHWLWDKFQASLAARTPCNNEYRIIAKSGEIRWVQEFATGIYGTDGVLLHIEGFVQDITSRKQAEAALQASEANLNEAQRIAHLGSWQLDLASDQLIWSNELYKLHEADPALPPPRQTESQKWFEPESWTQLSNAIEQVQTMGTPYALELEVRRVDGSQGWVLASGEACRDHSGEIVLLRGTSQDVTERKLAEIALDEIENQLLQSQKLEAVGTLAGGIAHDFNNILSGIYAFTTLASKATLDNALAQEYLGEITRAGKRAANLVRQILAFSREEIQTVEPVKLNDIVSEAVSLLLATIPKSIDLEIQVPENLPAIMGNPTQLHQVVMNLGINAIHAMGDSPGRLGIRLEPYNLDADKAQALTDCSPGPYLRLTISDTGHGMNAVTQTRVFEPFFTTKGPGEGTGLGLSVVHGIVLNHHGAIQLISEINRGTTIEVYLPTGVTNATTPELTDELATELRGNGEHILFVDDDPSITRFSVIALTELGYVAVGETRALDALARIESDPNYFQLVITDQTMPQITGLDLATRIHTKRANLPIVIVSGYSNLLTKERIQAAGVKEVLYKPYTTNTLFTAIHRWIQPDSS